MASPSTSVAEARRPVSGSGELVSRRMTMNFTTYRLRARRSRDRGSGAWPGSRPRRTRGPDGRRSRGARRHGGRRRSPGRRAGSGSGRGRGCPVATRCESAAARPRPRASGCVHTALTSVNSGVCSRSPAIATSAPSSIDAEVVAELDRPRSERPRLGEFDQGQHLGNVARRSAVGSRRRSAGAGESRSRII